MPPTRKLQTNYILQLTLVPLPCRNVYWGTCRFRLSQQYFSFLNSSHVSVHKIDTRSNIQCFFEVKMHIERYQPPLLTNHYKHFFCKVTCYFNHPSTSLNVMKAYSKSPSNRKYTSAYWPAWRFCQVHILKTILPRCNLETSYQIVFGYWKLHLLDLRRFLDKSLSDEHRNISSVPGSQIAYFICIQSLIVQWTRLWIRTRITTNEMLGSLVALHQISKKTISLEYCTAKSMKHAWNTGILY